ncbi:MAG: hypothetical protein KatS3mg118_0039 [Paracoccaceae bacterium]|nr:MAG: hypothetical protein KatS3mg118_0039 [Paracoccaceae bacterium]
MIQTHLQNPLAELLLAGEIREGSTVPVTVRAGSLVVGDRVTEKRPETAAVN